MLFHCFHIWFVVEVRNLDFYEILQFLKPGTKQTKLIWWPGPFWKTLACDSCSWCPVGLVRIGEWIRSIPGSQTAKMAMDFQENMLTENDSGWPGTSPLYQFCSPALFPTIHLPNSAQCSLWAGPRYVPWDFHKNTSYQHLGQRKNVSTFPDIGEVSIPWHNARLAKIFGKKECRNLFPLKPNSKGNFTGNKARKPRIKPPSCMAFILHFP